MTFRTLAMVATLGIFTVGCGGDTDPNNSDGTDGGDDVVSDPNADDDGDGISNADEEAQGLDPKSADTDGDGLEDGLEIDNGSDPLNMYSWPGDGIWPDRSAAAAAAGLTTHVGDAEATHAEGQTYPNFTVLDHNGEDVSLYQFYGHVVLLDFSAGWCGPCNDVARTAEDMWTEYRDDGFVIIHVMVDGWGQGSPAGKGFLNEWKDAYGLTFPVVGKGETGKVQNGNYQSGLDEGYIPFMLLLDQDMKVDRVYVGGGNESAIARRVGKLLE